MKKGMDPDAVDQVAQAIEDAGEAIGQSFQQVAGELEALDWTGEDRDAFVSRFGSEVGELVRQLQSDASDLAERARRNATAQRETSAS